MNAHSFRRATRNGLSSAFHALRLYVHYEWLPHRCVACGSVIAPGQDKRHLKWHYQIGVLMWSAAGGRGKKPKPPPWTQSERPVRTDTIERLLTPRETSAYSRAAEEIN